MQYGPRVAAVIGYLYAGQFLSKERTAVALAEQFDIPCSSGTVAALTAARPGGWTDSWSRCGRASTPATSRVRRDRIPGGRRLAWVHCARTGKKTLRMVDPKVWHEEAMEAMGAFPGLRCGRCRRCLVL